MMVSAPDILAARILIVDDQESNVSLIEQLLSEAGYTCVASTMNAREVCALHRADSISATAKAIFNVKLLDVVPYTGNALLQSRPSPRVGANRLPATGPLRRRLGPRRRGFRRMVLERPRISSE